MYDPDCSLIPTINVFSRCHVRLICSLFTGARREVPLLGSGLDAGRLPYQLLWLMGRPVSKSLSSSGLRGTGGFWLGDEPYTLDVDTACGSLLLVPHGGGGER